jgi:fructose-1,6-bisphosphatase I
MYPSDRKAPHGKLRLIYEAAPLAMLCEAAGGRASDGCRDILSIQPEHLHQRTPLYLGSKEFVDLAEEVLGEAESVQPQPAETAPGG